jgi:hypothetical protein
LVEVAVITCAFYGRTQRQRRAVGTARRSGMVARTWGEMARDRYQGSSSSYCRQYA